MNEGIEAPNCARCRLKSCYKNPETPKPSFCPMIRYRGLVERSMSMYSDEVRRVHRAASLVEREGYCVWPRLREVVEFARKLDVERLGVAFCIGLSSEAEYVVNYLESRGFKVYSVCCKCGGVDKTWMELREEDKLTPGSHESMCNPVVQAEILNFVGTELNIVLGLCVGHDTLFIKYSKAPVTYLAVKDIVTGHNPLAVIYVSNYFKLRL
ncbi:MAG: DUF1847 domain-containing protein [Sulfolobales archaeon]